MEDISIDGPFVTGNQFALFIDMQIVDLASGKRRHFAEIATFVMQGNKIFEERFLLTKIDSFCFGPLLVVFIRNYNACTRQYFMLLGELLFHKASA
jgi:hypothetical protein